MTKKEIAEIILIIPENQGIRLVLRTPSDRSRFGAVVRFFEKQYGYEFCLSKVKGRVYYFAVIVEGDREQLRTDIGI